MQVKISKIADLETCLGKGLARDLVERRRTTMMRLPRSVKFVETKPKFYLNDGGTLKAYAVDLVAGRIVAEHFCGSSDTVMNHAGEQLGEGDQAPHNGALVFVETYWNGRNTSWSVTVVSNQITKQVEVSNEPNS